jgi:hypothetical protein
MKLIQERITSASRKHLLYWKRRLKSYIVYMKFVVCTQVLCKHMFSHHNVTLASAGLEFYLVCGSIIRGFLCVTIRLWQLTFGISFFGADICLGSVFDNRYSHSRRADTLSKEDEPIGVMADACVYVQRTSPSLELRSFRAHPAAVATIRSC